MPGGGSTMVGWGAQDPGMGSLIYSMNVSLDGFIETVDRSLDWTDVNEEVHTWFQAEVAGSDALLYGRRLYEVMAAYWPYSEADTAAPSWVKDFGRVWLARPKIVFSSTLESVDWNSRLVRADPVAALPALKEEFPGTLAVAGPTLASAFIRANLVDEYRMVVHPVLLGAGKPYFPPLETLLRLRLLDTKRFARGAVALRYERVT